MQSCTPWKLIVLSTLVPEAFLTNVVCGEPGKFFPFPNKLIDFRPKLRFTEASVRVHSFGMNYPV